MMMLRPYPARSSPLNSEELQGACHTGLLRSLLQNNARIPFHVQGKKLIFPLFFVQRLHHVNEHDPGIERPFDLEQMVSVALISV